MQKQNGLSVESDPGPLPAYEQVHPRTLGPFAVRRENEATAFLIQQDAAERILAETDGVNKSVTDLLRYDVDAYADKHGLALTMRNQFLDKTRQRLADLNDEQKQELDTYLDASAGSFLSRISEREIVAEGDLMESWSTWLAGKADDEQLVNFLQWHVHTIAEQQSSDVFTERIKAEKESYKAAVQKGINQGWIHPEAERILSRVDDIDVYVGDVFDTILKSREAYHTRGTSVIVLGQGYGREKAERNNHLAETTSAYLKHELNHAVLGQLPYPWLDEAVTENLAEIFNNDKFEKTDYGYDSERELLNALMSLGDVRVPTRVVTRAYTDPKGSEGESYMVFARAMDTAWGVHDVLGRVEAMVRASIGTKRTNLKESEFVLMGPATEEILGRLRQDPKSFFKETEQLAA